MRKVSILQQYSKKKNKQTHKKATKKRQKRDKKGTKINDNYSRVQQVRRRRFASDQRNVLVQRLGVKEIHVELQVRGGIAVGDFVVVAPVKVVGLSTLAAHHEGVLAEIFVHGGGAAFLLKMYE